MQKKDFLYFLTDADGRCYQLDANGKVIINASLDPLNNTPDGWMDKTIAYARSKKYYGLTRKFTEPLKFVTDGATIIRYLYFTNGINAECFLRIAKLNRTTGVHERYFVGEMDFSTIQDGIDFVEISILDGGLAAKIKNEESTTYEIPLGDDTEDDVPVTDPTINVLMDGIDLIGFGDYFVGNGAPEAGNPNYLYGNHIVDLKGLSVENNGFGVSRDVTRTQIGGSGGNQEVLNTGAYLIDVTTDSEISFEYDFYVSVSADDYSIVPLNTNFGVSIRMIDESGSLVHGELIYVAYNKTDSYNHKHHIIGSVSFNGVIGCKIFLMSFVNAWGSVGDNQTKFDYSVLEGENSFFKLNTKVHNPPTYCKALRPSFVFDRLVHKLSKETNNTVSQILKDNDENFGYSIVLTTGNALRRLPSKMKITFSDFFKGINCLFNAGLGIKNEKAILEDKQYFYDTFSELTIIEDISELEVSAAKDHIFNLIKSGYQKQEYDKVNGKDEFNTTTEWKTPIKRMDQSLDLVNPWRGDMYGIEFTRIENLGKDTTDSESDDEIFILVIDNTFEYTDTESGEKYYKLWRGYYGGANRDVTGVAAGDTTFNTEISPHHIIKKHGDYIHSGLDKLDASELIFQTTGKNAGLKIVTALQPPLSGTNTFIEKENINISDLDGKLFLPYIFEFETKIPDAAKKTFDNNPRGFIKFKWNDVYYKGFILECDIQPAFKEAQTWKLLATADNDMSKLIYK